MLTLSRVPFGIQGNVGPTLLSWISLVGWETVSVITAAYALLGLLQLAGLPASTLWTVVSLVVVALLVVVIGLLGHATLVWIQRIATWIFGGLTLLVVIFLVAKTDWAVVLSAPPGAWDSGVLATLSIIIAGTGLSWANVGADYTRYLPRRSNNGAIVGWTVLGACIPLLILIIAGVLLSSRMTTLVSAANPVGAIGSVLPSWMAVPYLIAAIGGLIAGADLSIYSSGLNLLTLGLKTKRYLAVLIDGVIMITGAVYVMVIAQNFLAPFESFLQLLADGLAAWSAVFLVDMLWRGRYEQGELENLAVYKRTIYWPAVVAWLLGILVGLLFTVSPWWRGPLAGGIFASSSLGYLLGFCASALLYWGLLWVSKQNTARNSKQDVGTQIVQQNEVSQ